MVICEIFKALNNCFPFQEFFDERDADDVVWELNGRDLKGERCAFYECIFVCYVVSFNMFSISYYLHFRVIIEHARDPSSRRDSYGFRRERSPDRYRGSRYVTWVKSTYYFLK